MLTLVFLFLYLELTRGFEIYLYSVQYFIITCSS